MNVNILKNKNCYGCGVCAAACPKNAITIRFGKAGFLHPVIDNINHCIECGICVSICAFNDVGLSVNSKPIHAYAGWSNNQGTRRKCSSGGVAYEIGYYLIQKGIQYCGARYNVTSNRVEHFIATNPKEMEETIGSKYIQSYTYDALKRIDRSKQYLVSGTPCQIDSFRRYFKRFNCEDNFVLLDFYCHGVPSKLMWNKYLEGVSKRFDSLKSIKWREKTNGWHDSYSICIEGEKGETDVTCSSRLSQGDYFYKLFLHDVCLGRACYKDCKYKYDKSSADIRIGDFWGNEYCDNEEGVNAIIAFTDKGDELLKYINCKLIEHPFEIVAGGQMKKNAQISLNYYIVSLLLRIKSIPLSFIAKEVDIVNCLRRWGDIIIHPLHSFRRLVEKIKIKERLWK